MLGILSCDLSAIEIGERLRPADPARVEALAASISEIGLQEPIIVRQDGDRIRLVAGAHRLAAAKLLGWVEIAASWRQLTDDGARLVEIDENLIRAELTALDRAVALAERKRVYEVMHPETAHGGDRKRKPKAFGDQVANMATWSRYSKDAAAKTGLSERVIQRAVELVGKLSPAVLDELRQSPIADNQAQLIALAELPEVEQQACAKALAGGQAKTVEAARVASALSAPRVIDPDEIAVSRCIAIWERASTKARQRIFKYISLEQKGGPAKPSRAPKGEPA